MKYLLEYYHEMLRQITAFQENYYLLKLVKRYAKILFNVDIICKLDECVLDSLSCKYMI